MAKFQISRFSQKKKNVNRIKTNNKRALAVYLLLMKKLNGHNKTHNFFHNFSTWQVVSGGFVNKLWQSYGFFCGTSIIPLAIEANNLSYEKDFIPKKKKNSREFVIFFQQHP